MEGEKSKEIDECCEDFLGIVCDVISGELTPITLRAPV